MKLLLYCTKAKPYLRDYRGKAIYDRFVISPTDRHFTSDDKQPILNGKIVAECDFEVEEIEWESFPGIDGNSFDMYATWRCNQAYILDHSCLTFEQLDNYLGEYKEGYAIHIKNLHIFDKPINIKNYYNIAPRTMQDCMNQKVLVKAPQNMCNAYDVYKNHYILISIRPEWLCKILNGEKTIEVRKKVLKEMLK